MSDAIVRLFGPDELPVRIPDWPEGVGIAVCRTMGKTIALQPYHTSETGPNLRRRLGDEVGDSLRGFAVYPALRGLPEASIGYAEDQKIVADLANALRSMPRLVEAVQDFAINFEFAEEEGLGLDGLADQARRKGEPPKSAPDQLPVGYHPFEKPDPTCEVISGAMLKPVGAAGVDLILVAEKGLPSREMPPEVGVMVREDSLRVAIPLGAILVNGKLPPVVRLPAGSLLLGQTNGKPVPAMVLRRGSFLFVAPDYGAVSMPLAVGKAEGRSFPWLPVLAILLGMIVIAGIAVGTVLLLSGGETVTGSQGAVDSLRSNMFSTQTP